MRCSHGWSHEAVAVCPLCSQAAPTDRLALLCFWLIIAANAVMLGTGVALVWGL